MRKIFNRRIINKRNYIDDEQPMFRSKHQYNGIIHANIKREHFINKQLELKNKMDERKEFDNDLKKSSSPASIRKMQKFMKYFDYYKRNIV